MSTSKKLLGNNLYTLVLEIFDFVKNQLILSNTTLEDIYLMFCAVSLPFFYHCHASALRLIRGTVEIFHIWIFCLKLR